MRRRRRDIETFSLSFLDAVSCGFGAVILLLVISKFYEPVRLEESQEDLNLQVQRLEQEINDIRGETVVVNRRIQGLQEQISTENERLARLKQDLSRIRGAYQATKDDAQVAAKIEGRLARARQSLTAEMKRLLADYHPDPAKQPIGGVPVDSEYIIFIIDTSPSMVNNAWNEVQEKMREVLDVYPQVKGIQVMNDMGEYMFSSYRGEWIPDTPARRKGIIDVLRHWSAFSNSSPVEGISAAIRTYWDPNKRISLYVFGDEFTGPSMEAVVQEVDRLNRADKQGKRRVRIHAIGFPTVYDVTGKVQATGQRFAALMHLLCYQNGGTFVALPSKRR